MQLVAAIKSSSERVLARRMLVTFSPRDIEKVQQFHIEGKAEGKVLRIHDRASMSLIFCLSESS